MYRFKKMFDFGFDINNNNYDVSYLAIVSNLSMIVVLSLFGIINYLIKDNLTLSTLEFGFAFFSFLILIYYKQTQNLKIFLYLSTVTFFLISLLIYFYIDKVLFSAVWLFFFPLIAYLLNGIRVGTVFTLLYIGIIFIYSFFGIGEYTDLIGYLDIVISLSIFSFFVYHFEKNRKHAYEKMVDALKHLEEISHKDELTKLYNRHFLNTKIIDNINLKKKPFLFCITDIDNFKLYNDTYGHHMGDEALKKIAQIKKETIGDDDNMFVVRLGGEEFGGFIFDSNDPKARVDKFFEQLNRLNLEHKKNDPYGICTVSMGAVICESIDKFDFKKIYQLADKALYEAKHNGKNKVVYKTI